MCTPSMAFAYNATPYQYLVASIREFCTHDHRASRIEVARFKDAKYTPLTGDTVAHDAQGLEASVVRMREPITFANL